MRASPHFRTPASTCFCFELVLNALTLRSQRSAGCLGELFLRGFCADLLEPKQKEKLRSISGRSASLWFRAAASSPSRSSDPQQRSRGVWELVKAEVLPEPAWISAGSVRFGSVGSDAGELSTMINYWPKGHQKHTKRSSSPAHKQRFRTDPVRLEGGISFSFSMTAGMRWFRSISSSFHR